MLDFNPETQCLHVYKEHESACKNVIYYLLLTAMDEEQLRDGLQQWCEQNGRYELGQRIAFVPADVLKKLLGKTAEQAVKLLEADGY